ncbi:MAG TPA: glycosyl transferase family 90, partial [Chlamydiales bacterium]|nr:glycosyl transferase family 90 [Chlamydiales bacterium]
MKTISIIAFSISLAILALVVSQQRAAEKDYLKKETFVKQLNKDTFFTKLRKLPPQWMEEQISEDFQEFTSITKAKVDATFSKFEYIPNSYIVRYRIYNRELYRFLPAGELISSVDNSTEQALKTLIRLLPLPDMDFIFSYFDGIPLPPGLPNEYIFASSKELQAPVFFSAKLKNTQSVVLIPDARSIGNWWISDIKTIKSKMAKIPWEEKKNFALWRGSLTRPNRLKLCELSKLYPNYLDAKLSDKVNDDTRQKELEDAGLFGGKVSWEEFLSCKYLPTMDGVMCAAPALQWRLLSNSVTFKPETNEIQWFYRAL